MKLSKTYNDVEHELLTVKWNAYSFTVPALKLTYDYLTSGKQKPRANFTYRIDSWSSKIWWWEKCNVN